MGQEAHKFFGLASQLSSAQPITGNAKAKKKSSGSKQEKQRMTTNRRGEHIEVMDAHTRLAIMKALSKVDPSVRESNFYDPSDPATIMKEDVSEALIILRSWLRMAGIRALDLFQAWDQSGDFHLTRRELGDGLSDIGVTLSSDIVMLLFDKMCDSHNMSYDDFKNWFESTKQAEDLSDEEREARSVIFIQKCIRGRIARRSPG